eukprot:IDg4936t1
MFGHSNAANERSSEMPVTIGQMFAIFHFHNGQLHSLRLSGKRLNCALVAIAEKVPVEDAKLRPYHDV